MAAEAPVKHSPNYDCVIPGALLSCVHDYLHNLGRRIMIHAAKKPSGWSRNKTSRALTAEDILAAARLLLANAAQEFEKGLRDRDLLHAKRKAS